MNTQIVSILYKEEEIQSKVTQLAQQIYNDYYNILNEGESLAFIVVLKGSIFFSADLVRSVQKKGISSVLEFMKASSYHDKMESSGEVKLTVEFNSDVQDKHVVVVEDIVDTGNTLKFLIDYLNSKNPKSLKLVALLDKPSRREIEVKADYIGFEIPDKFVVGYGLDLNEEYRSLPYIAELEVIE